MVRNREELKRIFAQDPELYDRARPGYPAQLFDDLFALTNLNRSDSILEIGCGTGQATVSLAPRGCRLVCLELGERTAAFARSKFAQLSNVEVIAAEFESWDPAGQKFSMVFAATSWHWLDPDVRYRKAAGAIKPGGSLAIVSTSHVLPEDFDPFFTEIQDSYSSIQGTERGPMKPQDIPDERADIEGSGVFGDVRVRRYLWEIEYTASEYIGLLNTYSDHRAMESSKRDLLYTEIRRQIEAKPEGRIRKHYLNTLNIARLL